MATGCLERFCVPKREILYIFFSMVGEILLLQLQKILHRSLKNNSGAVVVSVLLVVRSVFSRLPTINTVVGLQYLQMYLNFCFV